MPQHRPKLYWSWELTPNELFAHGTFIPTEKASMLTLETRPFTCAKKPLEGTAFSYQLAVAERSRSLYLREVRRLHPELPVSGDERSGVIVFDGDLLIAAMIRPGLNMRHGGRSFVLPTYRRLGLSRRISAEFRYHIPFSPADARLQYTPPSTRSALASHKIVVLRAVQEGKPVPSRVLEAVTAGDEAARLIEEADRVQREYLAK
jgi:hypothetical protein